MMIMNFVTAALSNTGGDVVDTVNVGAAAAAAAAATGTAFPALPAMSTAMGSLELSSNYGYYGSNGSDGWVFPLALSCMAGASTCLGAAVVFCFPPHTIQRTMPFSLSLAASVMITISVVSIAPECLEGVVVFAAAATSAAVVQPQDGSNIGDHLTSYATAAVAATAAAVSSSSAWPLVVVNYGLLFERIFAFGIGCVGYMLLSKLLERLPDPEGMDFWASDGKDGTVVVEDDKVVDYIAKSNDDEEKAAFITLKTHKTSLIDRCSSAESDDHDDGDFDCDTKSFDSNAEMIDSEEDGNIVTASGHEEARQLSPSSSVDRVLTKQQERPSKHFLRRKISQRARIRDSPARSSTTGSIDRRRGDGDAACDNFGSSNSRSTAVGGSFEGGALSSSNESSSASSSYDNNKPSSAVTSQTTMTLRQEQQRRSWRVAMLLFVSLLAHNFPEGLAVAASARESPQLGLTVTIGILIHNVVRPIIVMFVGSPIRPALSHHHLLLPFLYVDFYCSYSQPEGIAISGTTETCDNFEIMLKGLSPNLTRFLFCGAFVYPVTVPCMAARPDSPWLAFWLASISGLAEPIGAAVALSILRNTPLPLENVLATVAGIMCMVAVKELYPESIRALPPSRDRDGRRSLRSFRQIFLGTIIGMGLMIATELYLPS